MSAAWGLRFGPVTFAVEGPPPHPLLRRYTEPVVAGARRVVVALAPTLPPATPRATADAGFAHHPGPDHDQLVLRGDPAAPVPWLAAFCELLAREAPPRGQVVLHAGAVAVRDAVALLVAPPGVGKTTAVRVAGDRAFAANAVLVDVATLAVRALPFAGDPAPELDSPAVRALGLLAFVHRHAAPTVEWMPPATATIRLMPHVTRPRGDDPHARIRLSLALALPARVRAVGLGLPPGGGYLAALDALLRPATDAP